MDSRIARIRRKLALVPYAPLRSHSFGEERHRYRLEPPLTEVVVSRFEVDHHLELPGPYRAFLTAIGGAGAAPFYGLLPLSSCRLFTMHSVAGSFAARGFQAVGASAQRGDLFLNIIEPGCTDVVLLGITGPLAGRVLTGNGDGWWGPTVSSAPDFLAWYERWLNHLLAGRDNRDLELTSPGLRAAVQRGQR